MIQNKIKHKIIMCFMVLVAMVSTTISAIAGTNSINLTYAVNNKTTPISGATFSLVEIASFDEEQEMYVLNDAFKSVEVNPNDITSENIKEATKTIYAVASKSDATRGTTDNTGHYNFENLNKGLFLVWQSSAESTASEYEYADPILLYVTSPMTEVYPKTDKIPTNKPGISGGGSGNTPPTVTPTTEAPTLHQVNNTPPDKTYGLNPDGTAIGTTSLSGVPKTGEIAKPMMYGSIIIALIIIGLWFVKSRRRKEI